MAIDFSFPPEIDMLRVKVREFIERVVQPTGLHRDIWTTSVVPAEQ